ncbi:hypothetical protein DdX_18917 [Ditylenchus destructor]|uniref:Uncharacterized protein n=1 Tax=Ditylenchus destructor TaxID=166010 RepID=A0AAD4QXM8_9BILA|nr:hypothetical protein DdX_18917 [Ditylenchus destructor]
MSLTPCQYNGGATSHWEIWRKAGNQGHEIFARLARQVEKLLEQYCVVTEVEVLTAPEYAALDKQVATGEILTDEDVLQLVARGNEAENDDSDDSDIEAIALDPPKISVADAIRGLETALSFMEQEKAENGDDLVATKRMIMRLSSTKLPTKQSCITKYFNKNLNLS